MNRAMLAFLAGASTTAIAMFLGGGGARAGVEIGASLVIVAIFVAPRATARLLLALADAGERFRESLGRPGGDRSVTTRKPASTDAPLTAIQTDVINALTNQGMARKLATARVRAAGEARDFETLFRKVVTA